MVQPYPITVTWKTYEKRFKVDSRHCGDKLLQTIRKEFWIPKEVQLIGLSNIEGELLAAHDLNVEAVRQAGSKFMLLLSATNSSSKIPLNLAGEDQRRPKDSDSADDEDGRSPLFQEIKNLDNFFGITLNGIKPNTRLLMLKISDKSELERFMNEGLTESTSKFNSNLEVYYYIQRGEKNEREHFTSQESCYYILGTSKKVSKYPIDNDTTLEDMFNKLHEDKASKSTSNNQHPIYIKEDFNLTDTEDRTRVEMRSIIKNLQRQKLLSDSDFICYAHLARTDDFHQLADTLQRVRKCRSELDIITIIKKRFLKCRSTFGKSINLEEASRVLSNLPRCLRIWLRLS